MRTFCLLFVLIVCFSLVLSAADNFTPLNMKTGLWAVTVTHSMSGMPAVNIPADALAKMPPEQRARIEAMTKGTPDVHKECVTKEKLEKHTVFSKDRGDCTHNVVTSSGSKLEVKVHCEDKQTTTDGTLVLEALNSDGVKGSLHSVVNSNGHTMNMDFAFSSRYLDSSCGDVK
jgi:hypothetical protein